MRVEVQPDGTFEVQINSHVWVLTRETALQLASQITELAAGKEE